ncbi:MAG: Gfo/Idh/MocA family oxidoreductase [Candidatus Latescibacteria bacterium]|nr:Gfo/Idh/MocA family oxidoreductase [Candidatus Latescibacterota bacterium]
MSDETIRVGIVGAGTNTKLHHIPGLQAIDGIDIVSVCNRSRESSERVAREFGIPTVYDHWWELIAAPDTNAIVIGTWPYLHCPVTLAGLAAGKHVLCEARMAMNAQEAQVMYDAARAHPGLVAQVVPSPMTLRVDKTIQRLIAEGYLGDILAIELRSLNGAFINPDAPFHWRQDFDLSGMNIMSLGIWYEAVMRWAGEAVRVTASGKTFVTMREDPESGRKRAVRIPEHLDVIAEMACGAQAHFLISSVAGLVNTNEVLLFGSAGVLRVADDTLYGGQRGETALHEILIPSSEAGRWRVEEEFVTCIRGQEVVTHTSFEDGVKYMEFTEAVTRSMAEGRTIPLPL